MEPDTKKEVAGSPHWHCLDHDIDECKGDYLVQHVISLFSRRYALDILRLLLMKGTLRFNQILKYVGGSPKTIADRLEDLVEAKMLTREAFPEIPPRVEYTLTENGRGLEEVFEAISVWVGKWGYNAR